MVNIRRQFVLIDLPSVVGESTTGNPKDVFTDPWLIGSTYFRIWYTENFKLWWILSSKGRTSHPRSAPFFSAIFKASVQDRPCSSTWLWV